ncbi:O-antigen ligase domain-containing protein [bacterium]|nr:MAG: O-antigen ligase domain-containing protein [bacterium]
MAKRLARTRVDTVSLAMAAIILLCALLLAKGSTTRIALAVAVVAVPLATYAALRRPLLFPYALYVLLVPFDNLLLVSSFGTLTKLLGILSGFAVVFWCLRVKHIALPPHAMYALVALLCWALASMYWTVSGAETIAALPQYLSLALLYAALAITPVTLQEFRWLLGATAIGGIAAAAYGIHQFYGNPFDIAGNLLTARLVIQAGNATIDPNQFADALLFPTAIVTMFALRTRWLLLKTAGFAGIALMVAAIALSASREALLGVGVIVAYYLWRTRYRLEMGIVVICGLAATFFVQSSMWLRFGRAIATGGAGRLSIWSVGFEAFRHRWLAGYGMGNFTAAYDDYYLKTPQGYPYGWSSPPHNLLVQVGVELGIIGLVLLAWFFVATFRDLAVIDRDHPRYEDRVMMEAALIALIFVSMFIGLFTYKYAWLVIATAAQLRLVAQNESARRRAARAP